MMTSMYPPSRGHYFNEHREHRDMYPSGGVAVKLEVLDDAAELPVDMTLTNRQGHGMRSANDVVEGDRSPYYDRYMAGLSGQAQHAVSVNGATVKDDSTTTSFSSQDSDFNGLQLKGSDGKLAVPAILGKSCRSFRKIDLMSNSSHQRAKREFVPDEKKDEGYWCKRLKNNDSARRSRVKRKALEKMMETRLMELQKENIELKHEMAALKKHFGIMDVPDFKSADKLRGVQSRMFPSSSSMEDILDKEDDLDLHSTGSDDSRSNDDSRVYSLGSDSSLNQSLGLAERFGVTNATSRSVSTSSASRSDSRSSHVSAAENCVRQDQNGALDLTSESSTRSSPPRDSSSPECDSNGNKSCSWHKTSEREAFENNIRSFPLKCRWKKEMHSAIHA